jgi:hypothetical protein
MPIELGWFPSIDQTSLALPTRCPSIVLAVTEPESTQMKATTRARDSRRLLRTLAAGQQSSVKGMELALAAGRVIERRTALGVSALTDPSCADHAEIARIIPEKAVAFGQVAAIFMQRSGEMAQRATHFAAAESAVAIRAAGQLTRCRSLAAIASLQGQLAIGFYSRAVSQSIAVAALAMQAYGDMVAPVHQAATRNSRRLGRSRA